MSPNCFPSYISWMCTLPEATKALCYSSIHQPCCSSLYQAISSVTPSFRCPIKIGTFPVFWMFGTKEILPLWAWDKLLSDDTRPTVKTLILPCGHGFYRPWPFLMQFVGVEGSFEVGHGQAFPGGGRQGASAPQSPDRIWERLCWSGMGCAQGLGTALLFHCG